jgi:hypothetical protein
VFEAKRCSPAAWEREDGEGSETGGSRVFSVTSSEVIQANQIITTHSRLGLARPASSALAGADQSNGHSSQA